MALPLIPRTGTSCPLIYLKVALEFFAMIFFAAAFGICLNLAYYFYLKGGFDADNFRDSQFQRDVFISVSIIYAVLTICSFVASLFTCHLLSDDIKDDDYCFKQLWKLLGLDKKKTPLPSPFDEEPKQDENAYLQPIVHFEGPGISGKSQPREPQKPTAAAMFSFVYNPVQNFPENMNYSETIIEKIPNHVDLESFILDKFPYRPIFDISIKPNMTSPEKLICNETIVSKIPSNVNMEDILLQKDPSKIERMIGL